MTQDTTYAVLMQEQEMIDRLLSGEIGSLPRGMYRAHRSIAAFTCAHCGDRVRRGKPMGYNSCLPRGHKEICADCFYGNGPTDAL
jgi:hypothetical protein